MRVIYTGGTFDLFHSGHVAFLRQCREIAGVDGHVIVALNRDEFIARFKRAPVMSLAERVACVRSIRYADAVVINVGDEDSTQTIDVINPTHVVIGDDWQNRDYHKQMGFTQDWLDERSITLLYVPYTRGISTTSLRQRMITDL